MSLFGILPAFLQALDRKGRKLYLDKRLTKAMKMSKTAK
jgi:hypothetical protein